MTRPGFGTHPFLLGFDQIERLAERAARGAEGYPPCNIEHRAPDGFRVTLAVAGFAEDELSVTMEARELVIRGRRSETGAEERVFLHRGIAARAFQRSFVLGEGLEVTGARLEHGLLHVDLERHAPDQIVQTIPISRR
ncbi:Hsp20 family protein [Paracoccus sp. S-4012]|uniref:Hsp20 family protein n=1 Tax=Paracoccus sp. S-4012 TaxID=2665648 RepID=UPI0012AF382F|nr:Hsp20 family protein [Paracoccus sp. S-4012]MRX50310.1 Hsp20 family protein [Paracoccus sp. S-4012]